MRVTIQRVSEASVLINQELRSEIGQGLVVLLGICTDDNADDIVFAIKKIDDGDNTTDAVCNYTHSSTFTDYTSITIGQSDWSATPTILRDTGEKKQGDRGHFVTAVTTINRKEYLQRFVSDWSSTKSNSADSTLIVADDGSTDGTLEWLIGELDVGESRLIVVKNNGGGIARQTNSILDILSTMGTEPDAIFMCNDDIRFLKSGWDDSYFSAMKSSGFDHLVYFNPDWKKPSHFEKSDRYEGLVSYCSARDAMGCFYTLTPRLIDRLGFFDEKSFPVRGHSHVDYTIRACRCEANDTHFLFDLINSNELIGMVMRDGYKRTFRTLSVKEMRLTTGDSELSKRESILLREGRIFVPKGW